MLPSGVALQVPSGSFRVRPGEAVSTAAISVSIATHNTQGRLVRRVFSGFFCVPLDSSGYFWVLLGSSGFF